MIRKFSIYVERNEPTSLGEDYARDQGIFIDLLLMVFMRIKHSKVKYLYFKAKNEDKRTYNVVCQSSIELNMMYLN